MLKLIAKAAGFLAYFFITLEMLFMATPFALYYYSAYRPLLSAPFNFPITAWLPAFFLPHLSSEILPNVGNLIFLLGLVGFLVGAFQVYRAKFTNRGVVERGFYKRIRHPQYLFLAVAGLGLLLTWPRFILLIIYVNMLWFYYVLARSEEQRMEARFGETYRELKRRTWMFLPWEPGASLQRRLFGWIHHRRARLAVTYLTSLIVATGAAFLLRELSLTVISHTIMAGEKVAAISFVTIWEQELRETVEPAKPAEELKIEKGDNRWILVQMMRGRGTAVHSLMDAGMSGRQARALNLADAGMKLIFSQQAGGFGQHPFGTRMRWQPAVIVELNDRKVSNKIMLDRNWFFGNPVMPLF